MTPETHLRVLHIGRYWRGLNSTVRHMMLGLKQMGADVYEFDTDRHPDAIDTGNRPLDGGTGGPIWLQWEAVRPIVESFRPHVIVCNAGGLSFLPPDAERLRNVSTLIGIALSDPDVFPATTSKISKYFDLFLTTSVECLPRYAEAGVNVRLLLPATNPDFFHTESPRLEYDCDVVIFGHAHADRVEPVRAIDERFNLHLYGEGWEKYGLRSRGELYGDDLLSALASARMTVIFNRTRAGHTLVKPGIFDFLAAGALVLTNHFSEIESCLTYERDIVGFRSTEDMLNKVSHYLRNPIEANNIRVSGQTRVLREHTWQQRWKHILKEVLKPIPGMSFEQNKEG